MMIVSILLFSLTPLAAQTGSPLIFDFSTNSAGEAHGGGDPRVSEGICLTDAGRARLEREQRQNIVRLRQSGKIVDSTLSNAAAPIFSFPAHANGNALKDFNFYGVSNFVDQNPAANAVSDYNCGNRTYDGHRGTDFFTYPFGWSKMDNNEVVAAAAADGVIVGKGDGNYDRDCSFNSPDTPNYILVRHADGTVSWYLHFKNGTATSKAVGDSVTRGEYLGIVGSSGISTGPHLHFEVHDQNNLLQDPFQGSCNALNNATYWLAQPSYRQPRINKLITHFAAPNPFPSCPTTKETINERKTFAPGDQLIVASYYTDEIVGLTTQYSLIRPDGTTKTSWTRTSPDTYNASYWYYTLNVAATDPKGVWTFRAQYNGQTYDTNFQVLNRPTNDFDGDGRADISVYRTNTWYWLNSGSNQFNAAQFGAAGDQLAPADYDGDGKTDVAVFRPSSGTWYILQSSNNAFRAVQFGLAEDKPRPGDFDGDGKADIAVYRPSSGVWYRLNSSNNQFSAVQFGLSDDVPLIADFDGDGKADVAVWRASNGVWYWLQSTDGAFRAAQFGQAGDVPVVGDYDADGSSDLAVWRPSNGVWYLQQSKAGFAAAQFGQSGDVPAPGDYDGDGKNDLAVYRNGVWYINGSQSGFSAVQFGLSSDVPVAAAYTR